MDVIEDARRQGFELEERVLHDQWMWGWRRDDDERWSCVLEPRLAVSWMRDRLRRGAIGVAAAQHAALRKRECRHTDDELPGTSTRFWRTTAGRRGPFGWARRGQDPAARSAAVAHPQCGRLRPPRQGRAERRTPLFAELGRAGLVDTGQSLGVPSPRARRQRTRRWVGESTGCLLNDRPRPKADRVMFRHG